MFKHCPDCRRELPLSEFTKNRRMRDGLSFYCKPCARARVIASKRARLGPPRTRHSQAPRDVPGGHKWCPECGDVKPVVEFPRNRAQRSGIGTYCKPCHNEIVRANKEKHGGARNYHLRRRYGITGEHYDRMLAEQDGLCAICRERPAAHVDHDHASGRVRGLLCFNCNQALGNFSDRTDFMLAAIAYLQADGITPLDNRPGFRFGVFLGDYASQRPDDEDDEPRIA